MIGKKRKPWRRYFPQDWFSDPELRKCSLSAKGLWAEMLAIAWLSPVEGYLVNTDGTPIDEQTLSKLVSETPGNTRRALAELESHGVFSRDDRGVIYSRRIVRDVEESLRKSQNGRLGGNPALMQDNRLDNQTDNLDNTQPALAGSACASVSASSFSSGGDARGGDEPVVVRCRGVSETDRKAAEAALDAWSQADRQTPLLAHRNELAPVWAALEEIRDMRPVPTPAGSMPAVSMVAKAVDAKRAERVRFRGVKFALGCVKTQLDEWALTGYSNGQPARPKLDLADPWGDKAKP